MKTYILTYNEIEGVHYWKDAKPPVEYLKNRHRHNFVIKCKFLVKHDDRDLEIIIQQNLINNYIEDKYGLPAMFGGMSCEMIAKDIVTYFKECVCCTVLEDGYGGAQVCK